MATVVGSGDYTYEVNEDWARIPEGWEMPAAEVAVDSRDRVFVYNRALDHPIVIFDRDGNFLDSWGSGMFAMPHGMFIDSNDNLWLLDRDHSQVMKFTLTGEHLMTIGTRGFRSDTGVDPATPPLEAWKTVKYGGPPFNLPQGIAVAVSGEVFVADGMGNCRVHRFSPEGDHLLSWGEPGDGPGQFQLPHGLGIDRNGRVLVGDESNNRIQVFNQDGEHLTTWPTYLVGPAMAHIDRDDIVYVPEHNGGLFSILTLEGERLAQWGSMVNRTCHSTWVDSHRNLYVVQPGEWGRVRRVVKYTRKS